MLPLASFGNLSLISPGVIGVLAGSIESHAALTVRLAEVEAARKSALLLAQLRAGGIAADSLRDLKDGGVVEAIVADPTLSRLVYRALDQIDSPQPVRLVAPNPLPCSPWPTEVRSHFRETIAPAGARLWDAIPDGFNWEAAIRDYSRRLHQGRLVYPQTADQRREWCRAVYHEQNFGRRFGLLSAADGTEQLLRWLQIQPVPADRTPCQFSPSLLGFRPLGEELPEAGDLLHFHNVIYTGAAILTQVTEEGKPIEVLLPYSLSLCLTCPENTGTHRSWHRFDPATKPDYLIVGPSPFESEEIRPPRLAELREVASAIAFTGEAFQILHRGEGSGLTDHEWLVDFDFANGDWVILHLEISGEGKKKKLSVIIDYLQRVATDPPDFIGVAERALSAAARIKGFSQLTIYYKTIYPLLDPKWRQELARGGYAKKNSRGWGRLTGKQIKLR